MDGKGRSRKSTTLRTIPSEFVERLWRSLKYECVYLHAWETGSQAKAGIARWMTFYNRQRSHTAHRGLTPAAVYWNTVQPNQQLRRVA